MAWTPQESQSTSAQRFWRPLCLSAALLPLLVTHASLIIAVGAGDIPSCNPYGPDCVSISRAGRQASSIVFFKSLMLPYALLVITLWILLYQRFTELTLGRVRTLGVVAAVFLCVYVLALGVQGDHWQLTRKIGVVLAFTLTYLADLHLLRALSRNPDFRRRVSPRIVQCQWALLLTLLAAGIASVLMDLLMADYDRWEDAVEWWLALLLYSFFATLAAWPEHESKSREPT